jgi:hypothetical protein
MGYDHVKTPERLAKAKITAEKYGYFTIPSAPDYQFMILGVDAQFGKIEVVYIGRKELETGELTNSVWGNYFKLDKLKLVPTEINFEYPSNFKNYSKAINSLFPVLNFPVKTPKKL